jgi:hypothetical protein
MTLGSIDMETDSLDMVAGTESVGRELEQPDRLIEVNRKKSQKEDFLACRLQDIIIGATD